MVIVMQWRKLRWYGHVLRKGENDWVKYIKYVVEGVRSRDRPKKTWTEVTEKDRQNWQLCKEDVMDRRKWRKLSEDVL